MTSKMIRAAVAAACLAVTATVAVGCSKTQEAAKDVASSATSAASSAPSTSVTPEGQADAGTAEGMTTVYYPEQQGAIFSVVAPNDWVVSKTSQVGDWAQLESPQGTFLQFRERDFHTDQNTKADLIMKAATDFIDDKFTDVKLDLKDESDGVDGVDGHRAFTMVGSGKVEGGGEMVFAAATVILDTDRVVEIWYVIDPSGTTFDNESDTAGKVLDSLKLYTPAQPAGAN